MAPPFCRHSDEAAAAAVDAAAGLLVVVVMVMVVVVVVVVCVCVCVYVCMVYVCVLCMCVFCVAIARGLRGPLPIRCVATAACHIGVRRQSDFVRQSVTSVGFCSTSQTVRSS